MCLLALSQGGFVLGYIDARSNAIFKIYENDLTLRAKQNITGPSPYGDVGVIELKNGSIVASMYRANVLKPSNTTQIVIFDSVTGKKLGNNLSISFSFNIFELKVLEIQNQIILIIVNHMAIHIYWARSFNCSSSTIGNEFPVFSNSTGEIRGVYMQIVSFPGGLFETVFTKLPERSTMIGLFNETWGVRNLSIKTTNFHFRCSLRGKCILVWRLETTKIDLLNLTFVFLDQNSGIVSPVFDFVQVPNLNNTQFFDLLFLPDESFIIVHSSSPFNVFGQKYNSTGAIIDPKGACLDGNCQNCSNPFNSSSNDSNASNANINTSNTTNASNTLNISNASNTLNIIKCIKYIKCI